MSEPVLSDEQVKKVAEYWANKHRELADQELLNLVKTTIADSSVPGGVRELHRAEVLASKAVHEQGLIEPPYDDGVRGAVGCCGGPPGIPGPVGHSGTVDEAGRRKFSTPETDADRKAVPVWTGVIAYFPAALVEIAKVSKAGNDQHNAGQPLHWAQEKSTDHANCAARHNMDADAVEGLPEELEHLARAAWRSLARLQIACQRHGAPVPPGARRPTPAPTT